MEKKTLYRSKDNRMISGVCAGLAEYFEVDPAVVRIIFLLLGFAGGPGVFVYLACIIAIPEEE